MLERKVVTNLAYSKAKTSLCRQRSIHSKYGFSSSHVLMKQLDYKESSALKNWSFCIVMLNMTLESPLDCKEIHTVHPKRNQSWIFIRRTDAEAVIIWLLFPTGWKRPWCWERLRAGGEGDDSQWDGWMASQTQWTWVWVDSGSWWWTRRPGVLWFMGLQRVGHDWATELNWKFFCKSFCVREGLPVCDKHKIKVKCK